MRPKPPSTTRGLLRDRAVLGVLALVVWWAVYWRVATLYGQGGGIIAATCAAWGYVLISTYAAYVLRQHDAGPRRPPGPPPGRWPGSPP